MRTSGLADADARAGLLARADAAWARTSELAAQAQTVTLGALRAAAG